MSGFQELLVILLIVLGIVFMPRMMPKQRVRGLPSSKFRQGMSGKMRLGIAFSVIYLAGAAAGFAPWRNDPIVFLYAGVGPVLAGWLICWVAAGFKKR